MKTDIVGASRQVSDVSYDLGDGDANISTDHDMMLMEKCREYLIFSNQRLFYFLCWEICLDINQTDLQGVVLF